MQPASNTHTVLHDAHSPTTDSRNRMRQANRRHQQHRMGASVWQIKHRQPCYTPTVRLTAPTMPPPPPDCCCWPVAPSPSSKPAGAPAAAPVCWWWCLIPVLTVLVFVECRTERRGGKGGNGLKPTQVGGAAATHMRKSSGQIGCLKKTAYKTNPRAHACQQTKCVANSTTIRCN